MAVGVRRSATLRLLLLLLVVWVTGGAADGSQEGHHQRHADFYRGRYHRQNGDSSRDAPHHGRYQSGVRETYHRQRQNATPDQDESHHRPYQKDALAGGESHHRHHKSVFRDDIYHRQYPDPGIRRADIHHGRPGSALVAPSEQEAAASVVSATRLRPNIHHITVQIGQTRQNYSVRDGTVTGAEHVTLWRDDQFGGVSDVSEISDIGGEVWLKNGTALYRHGDISDYRSNDNEIGDVRTKQHLDKEKQAKFFFPLFTLVRFPNDECRRAQSAGFTATGTCYLPEECQARGGLARGSCAMGFGVCCVFTLSCGGTTDKNSTFFVNPEFPESGTTARSCTFSVQKVSPNVNQIRLDFIEFEMSAPTDGNCNTDTFSVSGQNINAPVPTLCGQNSGQHIYLEVGERTGPIQLRAVTGPGGTSRRWRVKVTQYVRGADGAAPPHCLQYHTGRFGSIESFNYPTTGAGAGYLNQLNYMICIRKESGFCSITYGVDRFDRFSPPEEFDIFNVRITIVNGVTVVQSTVPPGQAGVGPVQCPEDYILLSADRLCGERLNDGSVNSQLTENADVTDDSGGQFTVKFVTGEETVGRGFKLYFRQNPCRSRRTPAV